MTVGLYKFVARAYAKRRKRIGLVSDSQVQALSLFIAEGM
jgi:hypothetical protein